MTLKQTFMTLAIAACCGFAGTAGAAGAAMSKSDYDAQKERIDADHKAGMERCKAQKENAKDICEAEAKGNQKVAKAELEAQYKPGPRNEAKMKSDKAEASYEVAKEKCDDLTGNAKNVCRQDARAAYESAKGEAKVSRASADKGAEKR